MYDCNQITDISHLQYLTKLEILEISMCNQITDLDPLQYMGELRVCMVVTN